MQTFRPPSVPLVTVDPYFSVWSAADRLYDDHTRHWTGKRCGMTGLIRIDGKTRRFMGKMRTEEDADDAEIEPFSQTGLHVEPVTTLYRFEGEGIELEVRFTTPLLLDDLELLSRPVTYVSFHVRATDGRSHDVRLYLDVTGEWCVNTTDQPVVWSRPEISGLAAMRMGTEEQQVLQRVGDDTRIDWGYCYLAVPDAGGVETFVGSVRARERFAELGRLPDADDERQPRPVDRDTPVMAAVLDLGAVGADAVERFAMLAYDDICSIEYFGRPLEAYWRKDGTQFEDMLVQAAAQYDDVQARCGKFNDELASESAREGGDSYRELLALAYRQAIAAHKLAVDPDDGLLFFSKENFSNGCIATVDVSYPSIPLFLRYNPELVKGMMRPIFRYADSKEWPYSFAPHDAGCYPKANGQVYGENKLENQMPIEECGNMLVMTAAVCLYERDPAFAGQHWKLLSQWAEYLLKNGLDPANQLCTDDFAGHSARNANLSVKAIVGLGAYAVLCRMLGKPGAEEYAKEAAAMAAQWVDMARAADGHFKRTFGDAEATWSMKYNLVWDRLLGLSLFPQEVVERECALYLDKANQYGTPLDDRADYTKADWLVWCASMLRETDDFERLIRPLRNFLHESPSRVPLTDWYDTVTGKQVGFQNRSVVGGLFIRLLQPVSAF
ncbi:glutaminase family protein [Cohnella cellulosilytica]|uniref:Glutaminase domain-containing protein n=1 Tax=Cohnella cellulosilytica TaxID=986710 RepID=A0ABW2FGC1_9BACL